MFIIVLVLCALTVRANEPECGIVTLYGSQALIIGGKAAQRGEVPWHVGIYTKTSNPYKQICGGSLLSNHIILSAAHCFWDEIEKQLPADRYAAAVGKLYRPWEPNITKEEDQKADVKEIHLPVRYQGSEANNQEDIAIIKVNTPFQYSRYVRPICVDFDLSFDRTQLQPGKYGKVAGWGLVGEDGESSHILKLIELPYVDTKTCILESPFTYRPHITGDKFCAGYRASNAGICKGDSGGGLAFPFTDKGGVTRYYLRGVVSSAPVSDHKCNANTFTSFTQVQKHEYFIRQFWGTTLNDVSAAACSPLPLSLTKHKTGQKAWDKCIEYQEKLVFPCSASAAGSINRANRCRHNAADVNTASEVAHQNEFPHMALIGYGDDVKKLSWICAGALISDKFVLNTGQQCRSARENGPPTYVALNTLKRSDDYNAYNRVKIERIHKHPDHHPPKKYNDIALLELTQQVSLSEFLVPACLDTGKETIGERAFATGWGTTHKPGPVSNDLKKIPMTKFDTESCAEMYPLTRILRDGIDPNTQHCYEMATTTNDTCFIDGGGPLQVLNKEVACMYTVVGLTSFARGCGNKGEPAVYTKVAHYLDWIENIVWP